MYPLGRSLHSKSPAPSAWCQAALYNLSVCSTLAVLKWPQLPGKQAALTDTLACPFCFFRCNTVMHSAVTHHSQWSGFFSPASDVVRAVWEEVRGGGVSTWTTVCPGVLGVRSLGGGTPTTTPQVVAGSWAVLAAERALMLPALQRG